MLTTTWQTVSNLDRFIDDVMGSALGAATDPRAFNPSVDVRASDNEVRVICDVPGVRREDLDITLENRVLTIKRKPPLRKQRERTSHARTELR